jgi:FixJ family two-component response regulator
MNAVKHSSEIGHIYLIDDDDDLRTDIALFFTSRGYTVHTFANAIDFTKGFVDSCPAVVVTDMVMPGMSGVELQLALLKSERELPFIFISGQSADRQIIAAMKNGVVDFLLKPFKSNELLAVVQKGLLLDQERFNSYALRIKFHAIFDLLSPREKQVFHLLAKGFDNQKITKELFISLPTAKQYKSQLMQKMGFTSLADLMESSKHYSKK